MLVGKNAIIIFAVVPHIIVYNYSAPKGRLDREKCASLDLIPGIEFTSTRQTEG